MNLITYNDMTGKLADMGYVQLARTHGQITCMARYVKPGTNRIIDVHVNPVTGGYLLDMSTEISVLGVPVRITAIFKTADTFVEKGRAVDDKMKYIESIIGILNGH